MNFLLLRSRVRFGTLARMKSLSHRFFIKLVSSVILIASSSLAFSVAPLAEAATPLNAWWPSEGAHLTGAQPFKALVEGADVSTYDMYWQVDGGQLNPMQTSTTDYPHKEASVDVSGWSWKGQGPYAITFVAKQNGQNLGSKTVNIYVGAGASAAQATVVTSGSAASTASAQASAPAPTSSAPAAGDSITVWWPTKGSTVGGSQPFKADVPDRGVDSYTMYWQVDGGAQNVMSSVSSGSPHKEAPVDVSGWHWESSGVYTLTFTAKDGANNVIATYSEPVLINAPAGATAVAAPSTLPSPTPAPQPAPASVGLSNSSFYTDPNSSAAQQANAWASSRPSDAALMRTLASAPTAKWFGGWSGDVRSAVSSYVGAAASAGKTATLVAYNIPDRDCGGYSAGGTSDYLSWISSFASGIGSNSAVVILEPDALSQMSCLSQADQATRYDLLAKAVTILKQGAHTKVYLDAGHAGWVDASDMAGRLSHANIAAADGFALNVSNYDATSPETTFGLAISSGVGGKHFVIDTSRNGNGSNGEWCNATGRAIGTLPTTQTNSGSVDAYLWVKTPGESDGSCNGGPSAGTWWPDYALSLVKNAQH